MTAQFSILGELRGYEGFESVYQGQAGSIPIPLSPYKDGLDPQASEQLATITRAVEANGGAYPVAASGNGIHPFLIGGLATPMGATAIIWVPQLEATNETAEGGYNWYFVWRMRSAQVNQQGDTRPFNSPYNRDGATDNGRNDLSPAATVKWSGQSTQRYIIPAAVEVMRYVQDEPTVGAGGPSQDHAWWSTTRFLTTNAQYFGLFPGPLYPDTATSLGQAAGNQGLFLNPGNGLSLTALHSVCTRMCMGNEFFMLIQKRGSVDVTWDFTSASEDANVSYVLGRGTPNAAGGYTPLIGAGVLVGTGLSPLGLRTMPNFNVRMPRSAAADAGAQGIDTFDDYDEHTGDSLGGSEALQDAMSLRPNITSAGIFYPFLCSCLSRVNITVTWPELAYIGAGISPTQVGLDGNWVPRQDGFLYKHACGCRNPQHLVLSPGDALDFFRRQDVQQLAGADQAYVRAYHHIQQLRANQARR